MTFASSTDIAPIQLLSDQIRLLHRSTASPSRMGAMLADVPPGGFVPPHSRVQEEGGCLILEGEPNFTIGGETKTLGSGDFGHVKPRMVHGYANRSDRPVRFLA